MIHLEFIGQFLEFAVPTLGAEHAVVVSFGKKVLEDGSKVRFCKKCGEILDK